MAIRVLDMKTVSADGKWVVSTVALNGAPLELFETMVFPAAASGSIADFAERYCERYEEASQAELGHEIAVAALNAGQLELY